MTIGDRTFQIEEDLMRIPASLTNWHKEREDATRAAGWAGSFHAFVR
jgi:hypothetical protein